jgi:hypothetical protein
MILSAALVPSCGGRALHGGLGRNTHVAGQLSDEQLLILRPQCGLSRLVSTISRSTCSGNWLA